MSRTNCLDNGLFLRKSKCDLNSRHWVILEWHEPKLNMSDIFQFSLPHTTFQPNLFSRLQGEIHGETDMSSRLCVRNIRFCKEAHKHHTLITTEYLYALFAHTTRYKYRQKTCIRQLGHHLNGNQVCPHVSTGKANKKQLSHVCRDAIQDTDICSL
jgi:hypothetical protein